MAKINTEESTALDQMFLLVLGCCIFCEYQFSLKLHFTSLMSSEPPISLQNRRDFLRISGEQRRKRGERVASASCVRGEER